MFLSRFVSELDNYLSNDFKDIRYFDSSGSIGNLKYSNLMSNLGASMSIFSVMISFNRDGDHAVINDNEIDTTTNNEIHNDIYF